MGFAPASALPVVGAASVDSTYRANLSSVEKDLRAAASERPPPDPSAQGAHARLVLTYNMMEEAEAAGDFATANDLLDEIAGRLDDYKQAKQAWQTRDSAMRAKAKSEYEVKLKSTRATLDALLASQPFDPASKKLLQQLGEILTKMYAAAAQNEYVEAMRSMDALPALIERLRAGMAEQVAARQAYRRQVGSVHSVMHKAIEEAPPRGYRVMAAHDALVQQAYTMEAAANAGDYVTAEKQRPGISALIDAYRKAKKAHEAEVAAQQAAKRRFETKIDALRVEVAKIEVEVPLDEPMRVHKAEIVSLASQIDFSLPLYDYVACDGLADLLTAEIDLYNRAKARAQKDPALSFKRLRPSLESLLQGALKPPRTDKFMADLQKKLVAKVAAIDKAVADRKFDVAYPELLKLQDMLKVFGEEDRKTPHPCDWLVAVAISLMGDADVKYNLAANTLDELADAYDAALKVHQDALERMKERRRLEQAILELVFMVALPGALGGAAANGIKLLLSDAASKSMKGGALIDGSKDVLKFVTKVTMQFGLKAADSGAAGVLKGSGVTLTRSIAKLLRSEKIKVSAELKKIGDLLVSKADECAKGVPIRVEGDPRQALVDDPFFKVIEGVGAADQKGFANAIWREWIRTFAYRLRARMILVTPVTTIGGKPLYAVESNFDEKLIPEIEKQVNFNVRRELEAAGAALRGTLDSDGAMTEIV